jgi:hypothetical protein
MTSKEVELMRWTPWFLTRVVTITMAFAAPALAGGPLEAPDGGGPLGTDFTGWTPVAFLYGGVDNATTRSRIICTNLNHISTDVAIQWYTASDSFSRQPLVEEQDDLLPSDADDFVTDGTLDRDLLVRVLVSEKKAQIHCSGRIEVGGAPGSPLEVVYVKKAPKVRVLKK